MIRWRSTDRVTSWTPVGVKNILVVGIYAHISREAEDVALGGDVVKVEACVQPSHLSEHAEVL